jgi:hypothetical protein
MDTSISSATDHGDDRWSCCRRKSPEGKGIFGTVNGGIEMNEQQGQDFNSLAIKNGHIYVNDVEIKCVEDIDLHIHGDGPSKITMTFLAASQGQEIYLSPMK